MMITDLFPFQTMRDSQRKVLDEIESAFRSGYSQIVLEASTGFGKSPVAIAVARFLKSSYICTSTINLQDQYLRDFSFLKKVIGKNNFDCKVQLERKDGGMFNCERCETNDYEQCKHTTVDKAPCINKRYVCPYMTNRADYDEGFYEDEVRLKPELIQLMENPRDVNTMDCSTTSQTKIMNFFAWDHYKQFGNNWSPCNYYHQKNVGLLSPHTIFNYAIFNKMSQVKRKTGKPYLAPKGILILDEGHLFENEVIAHNGEELELGTIMNITHDQIRTMPDQLPFSQWVEFLKNVLSYTQVNLDELQNEYVKLDSRRKQLNQRELKRFYNLPDILRYVEEKHEKLQDLTAQMEMHPENWIIDRNGNKLIIKPLDISAYCRELYEAGNRLLVMSATILDKDLYCNQIGLNPSEVKFISIDSEFPVENRPIFTPYLGKLSKDNIDLPATHQVIANNLNKILTQYTNQRGLIHMPTNKLIDQILPHIKDRRRIYVIKSMTSRERARALKEFEDDPRGVLMSPSLYVGIDLKDDLSRFQVIVKIPYPSLGDKWIKKKFDQNKKWYTWQTVLKVIQGYGRSVRSKDDYADTYILDQNLDNILRFSSSMLPKSFTDAIKYGKNNPNAKIGDKVRVKHG
jgi:ATP-dependent DNA helicase DinG